MLAWCICTVSVHDCTDSLAAVVDAEQLLPPETTNVLPGGDGGGGVHPSRLCPAAAYITGNENVCRCCRSLGMPPLCSATAMYAAAAAASLPPCDDGRKARSLLGATHVS